MQEHIAWATYKHLRLHDDAFQSSRLWRPDFQSYKLKQSAFIPGGCTGEVFIWNTQPFKENEVFGRGGSPICGWDSFRAEGSCVAWHTEVVQKEGVMLTTEIFFPSLGSVVLLPGEGDCREAVYTANTDRLTCISSQRALLMLLNLTLIASELTYTWTYIQV